MTVETEVAALTSAVNLLTSTVNVSKATLDASVAAAEAAYDSFDDRYLGAKVSAPSLDNDGGSLLTGALYFNSTENAMYVYTGASWVITTNYNNVTAPYTLAQTLNTNGNNVTFGDNGKAIFGAGSDLQIYHDGGHSYIDDSGTGLLRLRSSTIYLEKYTGELMADFNADGHVSLLHDNFEKFRTTATGIDVTGTATMDGLTVDGNPIINGTSPQIFLQTGASHTNWQIAAQENVANAFEISSGAADASAPDDTYTKRLVVQNNGNLSLYEDTGTTAKFFWDASAESLDLTGTGGLDVNTATGSVNIQAGNASADIALGVGSPSTANKVVVTAGGNVGIGTALPTNGKLVIEESGTSVGSTIRLIGTNTSGSASQVSHITSYQPAGGAAEASALDFKVRGTDPYATPSTVMTLLGGGKVGIGTSSPSQKLSVADGAHITGANATAADTSGSYTLAVGANAGARSAIFAGDVVVSGGVVFGTTGGSVTSKTLDDYEEGTWTPVVSGSTTAGSATYTIQQGVYTKIGNVVRWNARVGYTGHTGTGNMLIWGLPFTNANKYAAGSYSFRDGLTLTAGDQLIVSIPPNNTYIGLYGVASGTDTTAALALDTAVSDISINGVYTV
jgi:hypothetical protein